MLVLSHMNSATSIKVVDRTSDGYIPVPPEIYLVAPRHSRYASSRHHPAYCLCLAAAEESFHRNDLPDAGLRAFLVRYSGGLDKPFSGYQGFLFGSLCMDLRGITKHCS